MFRVYTTRPQKECETPLRVSYTYRVPRHSNSSCCRLLVHLHRRSHPPRPPLPPPPPTHRSQPENATCQLRSGTPPPRQPRGTGVGPQRHRQQQQQQQQQERLQLQRWCPSFCRSSPLSCSEEDALSPSQPRWLRGSPARRRPRSTAGRRGLPPARAGRGRPGKPPRLRRRPTWHRPWLSATGCVLEVALISTKTKATRYPRERQGQRQEWWTGCRSWSLSPRRCWRTPPLV